MYEKTKEKRKKWDETYRNYNGPQLIPKLHFYYATIFTLICCCYFVATHSI